MPKRTGAKKGHQCSKGYDPYCRGCLEKRLKRMHLTMDAGARRDKLSLFSEVDMARFADPKGPPKGTPRCVGSEPLDSEDYHADDRYIAPQEPRPVHQKNKTRLSAIVSDNSDEI